MHMNTPNKLTVARMVMAPFFLLFLLWRGFPFHYGVALLLFVAASVTDYVDGNMARSRQQVTNFGKFLDPLADKILVTAAFLGFVELDVCSAWIPMLVLAREFVVTSIRLLAANEGTVIAANIWGKAKTVTQMIAIILTITVLGAMSLFAPLREWEWILMPVCNAALWMSAVMTLISGATYLQQNRRFLRFEK